MLVFMNVLDLVEEVCTCRVVVGKVLDGGKEICL